MFSKLPTQNDVQKRVANTIKITTHKFINFIKKDIKRYLLQENNILLAVNDTFRNDSVSPRHIALQASMLTFAGIDQLESDHCNSCASTSCGEDDETLS